MLFIFTNMSEEELNHDFDTIRTGKCDFHFKAKYYISMNIGTELRKCRRFRIQNFVLRLLKHP